MMADPDTPLSARESALVEEARMLRRVAQNVPVAIAYYERAGFRCRYANAGYARMFGLDEHGILGRSFADVIGREAAALIQPKVDTVLSELRSVAYERELPPDEGGPRFIEVSLVPHVGADGVAIGAFVLIADITRHRRAERALRDSEDRLARFMQATAEGIVFHRSGFITDANPPVLALLGYTLDEIRGRWAIDFVAPDQRERVGGVMAAGAELRYETALLHRDGTRIPVEFIVRSVRYQQETLRMTIVRDMRDRLEAQARIRHLAAHDSLTGLPNRAAFIEGMHERLAAAGQDGSPLAVLFIDLDHFKRVNDSLGHLAGDALLRTVAERITGVLRASDLVARFGGDEFLVLLGGELDRATVDTVARKLLAVVGAPVAVQGTPISVTPSVGIAMYPQDGRTADELIQHADTAMYHAKAAGRADCRFFEPAMAERVYAELLMEGRLTRALQDGQFELHFQPELHHADGAVVCIEALLRWRDPARGLVGPDEFLPLAEARGLMLPIGRWVLRKALRHARSWQLDGEPPVPVAVNLSLQQLQVHGFVDDVTAALAEAGLAGDCLELELTESMLMGELADVRCTLERLRAQGIRVAVDDFGTGYTSLAHLRDLPLDRLKIDRSFVRELPDGAGSVAIARAIVQLAGGLGLQVVAEGVETEAQREWVVAQGCQALQGRLIVPPLDADALRAWLTARRQR